MRSTLKPVWFLGTGLLCLVSVVWLGTQSTSIGQRPTQEIVSDSATQNGSTQDVVKWETAGDTPTWLKQREDNEIETMIRDKLRERSSVSSFSATPLSRVAIELSQVLEVDVMIDERDLNDASISPEVPITIQRKSPVRYKDFLKQMLDPLELTYVIKYDAILITTKDGSKGDSVRFYDLSYVLPDNGLTNELMQAIEQHVTPDVWEVHSGTSSLSLLGSMLVVSAPEESHEAVEEFLRKITKQSSSNMKPQSSKHTPVSEGMSVSGMGIGMGMGMGGGFGRANGQK